MGAIMPVEPTPRHPKDEWVLGFVNALMRIRKDMGNKFAYLVAKNEWTRAKHLPPATAAKQWAERVASAR